MFYVRVAGTLIDCFQRYKWRIMTSGLVANLLYWSTTSVITDSFGFFIFRSGLFSSTIHSNNLGYALSELIFFSAVDVQTWNVHKQPRGQYKDDWTGVWVSPHQIMIVHATAKAFLTFFPVSNRTRTQSRRVYELCVWLSLLSNARVWEHRMFTVLLPADLCEISKLDPRRAYGWHWLARLHLYEN